MDKQLHALPSVQWNYCPIPKLKECNRWSLWMDKQIHPLHYSPCDYLSTLGLMLIHLSKMDAGPVPVGFFNIVIALYNSLIGVLPMTLLYHRVIFDRIVIQMEIFLELLMFQFTRERLGPKSKNGLSSFTSASLKFAVAFYTTHHTAIFDEQLMFPSWGQCQLHNGKPLSYNFNKGD